MAKIKVCRRETFCAAHQLINHHWPDEKNRAVFDKCYHPNYHGHNYVLETWLQGEIDQETGYLYDLKKLKKLIKEEVLRAFDHKNFNLDVPEFKMLNPTAENIAVVIYNKLRLKIEDKIEIRIRLFETNKNSVEYGDF